MEKEILRFIVWVTLGAFALALTPESLDPILVGIVRGTWLGFTWICFSKK